MSANRKAARTEAILHGSLWKAILMIAIPVMINSLLQTLYNLTDTYWLGRIGTEPLAAINLVSPVQGIIVSFGSGFTVAGAVLLSQLIGAGKPAQARKMANQIFMSAMAFSVVCIAAMESLMPLIMNWLGAEGRVLGYAYDYLRIVTLDIPFLFTINLYQSVRQSQGDTVSPMLLNLLGIGLNMVLDPLLMIVWKLNATGAALATLLAKVVPALIALRFLRRSEEIMRLECACMKPDKSMLLEIARIGLPTAFGASVSHIGFLMMTRSVFSYGVKAIAAYGIANKSNSLNSLPSSGIGAAVATIVGQNMGAGQVKRAEKGYRAAMGGIVALLMAAGVVLSRRPVAEGIVSIFSTDPDVIAMAADYFALMAMWTWNNGVLDCTASLFRACGHTGVTMVNDIARIWVFRFATLFVCQRLLGLGVESIWYSVVISNGLAALMMFVLYLTGMWKKNKINV